MPIEAPEDVMTRPSLTDSPVDLAFEKGKTLVSHGCAFSEFGTRRRRSYRTQEIVVENLVKASEAVKGPGRLTGTSNVRMLVCPE